jgi:hypothetical protein
MYTWDKEVELSELVGKTIKSLIGLSEESDEVKISTECGQQYMFHHEQDCCESVRLNDFEADHDDFIGAKVISAEEVSSDDAKAPDGHDESWGDSYTWTFYKIETDKGGIWMRWLGESNGYYSESVSFIWVNKPETEED